MKFSKKIILNFHFLFTVIVVIVLILTFKNEFLKPFLYFLIKLFCITSIISSIFITILNKKN